MRGWWAFLDTNAFVGWDAAKVTDRAFESRHFKAAVLLLVIFAGESTDTKLTPFLAATLDVVAVLLTTVTALDTVHIDGVIASSFEGKAEVAWAECNIFGPVVVVDLVGLAGKDIFVENFCSLPAILLNNLRGCLRSNNKSGKDGKVLHDSVCENQPAKALK